MEIVTITEARRRLRGALSSSQKEIETVSPETAVGRIAAKDMTAANRPSTAMPSAAMIKRPTTSSPPSGPASSMRDRFCRVRPSA